MRLLTSSPAVELHSLYEWIVVLKFCLLGNNVLFLLNVTEDQPTGPLSFRERLFVIRVSTPFTCLIWNCSAKLLLNLISVSRACGGLCFHWEWSTLPSISSTRVWWVLWCPLAANSAHCMLLVKLGSDFVWCCENIEPGIFSLSVRWNSCSSTIFSWPMQLSIAGQWSITENIQYEWLHADCLGCAALLVSCLHPQVSDSVPAWCTALSILSALGEIQESVDSQCSAGEKWE